MSLPDEVREELKERIWSQAEQLGWVYLSPTAKSRQYDNWSRDRDVGGLLERFVDRRQVRTYLKETLLREYAREHHMNSDRPFRVLGIPESAEIAEIHEKPHGRRLTDGRVVAWGRATEWKTILLAVHERSHEGAGFVPHGVVLLDATGRYAERRTREMIEDAAAKLKIVVCWIEL